MQRKADSRGGFARLDRFIFCTAVCGNAGFCKEQAKEHTMYVTARATPARRGIDHNAKQKTLLKKLGKTPVEEVSLGFFFRKKESFAKKLNRVTPSTTCVRNMLSTYIGNRAIFLQYTEKFNLLFSLM